MVGSHLVVFFFNKGAKPAPAASSAGSTRGKRRYSIQLADGSVVYGSYHKLASIMAQRGTVASPEPSDEDEEHMMLAILLLTV